MNKSGAAAIAAVLLLLSSTAAFAQSSTVSGRVSNAQGGVIANAEVTLRTLPPAGMPARMPNRPGMQGMERTAQTRADGTFSFDQVAPGQYVLMVDSTGFERTSQELTVANQPQNLTV